MAALRSGETDWWEAPLHDQAEGVAHDRNITVISQYATAMGFLGSITCIRPLITRRCGEHCSALSIRPRR